MNKIVVSLLLSLFGILELHSAPPVMDILPAPLFLQGKSGVFQLSAKQALYITGPGSESMYLQRELVSRFGSRALLTKNINKAGIVLQQDASKISAPEGYQLDISASGITITGHDAAGLFYGIQSLLQLMEKNREADKFLLPCLFIKDQPRFGWRAFMLDEARFFKGEHTVKQLLDEMAALKMNVFHWHLTDDQGWRVESKKYPLLTQVGSKRKDTQSGGWKSTTTYGEPHEGFYTQDQIREIVRYARERHIKVVPEIEMPGHASAAIAAYPWLGSNADTVEVPVTFGKHYPVYNVTEPRVVSFLQDVVAEMITLFDTDVIHIGGDEVRFTQWENNAAIRRYKEDRKFSSFMDIQIEFTNNMSKFIASKNCRMMGWNEILGKHQHKDDNISFDATSQQIASNVVVHFWVGDPKQVTDAAEAGYQLVNSFHSYTYLDYNYEQIPLQKAYGFEPVPTNLPARYAKNIIGLGCQMWGEWIPTVAAMQEKVFPRIAAYAEVGWSAPENKDYGQFLQRLASIIKKWKAQGIRVHE